MLVSHEGSFYRELNINLIVIAKNTFYFILMEFLLFPDRHKKSLRKSTKKMQSHRICVCGSHKK